jgi:hypothetical protein
MKSIKTNIPPIGMRILKSAIGVWLCYLIYLLRGKQGIVFLCVGQERPLCCLSEVAEK